MKKASFYWFIRDVIRCSPGKLGSNFIYIANHHSISKEVIRKIFKDEVKSKKIEYKILNNILIIQYSFINALSRFAIYEVIEIANELKFCLKTNFKNLRTRSAHIILSLFALIYFEYKMLPGRKEEGEEYINMFKEIFSKQDIIDIIASSGNSYRWILERQGIDLGIGKEISKRLTKILDKFYGINIV